MATQKSDYRLRNVAGGLNAKENPSMLENNEFQEFKNIGFNVFGLGQQRKGEVVFGERFSSYPVHGIGMLSKTGSQRQYLVASNGDIWSINSSGGISNSPLETGLSTEYIDFVEFDDYLYLCDADNRMRKYDGNDIYLAGIEAPTSSPSLSSGGSGQLTGDYTYLVTFSSPSTESYPSPETNTISVSDEEVSLTDIPSSPESDVNEVVIYRTTDGGSTFFEVDRISNGTSSYTDNTHDSELGTQVDMDSGLPKEGMNVLEKFHNHLFGAGYDGQPSRLYYSEQLEPEKWDELNFINVLSGLRSPITALQSAGDQLYIFKETGLSILSGFSEKEFTISDVSKTTGTPSQKSVTEHNGVVYFYDGSNSVYQISSSNIDIISFKVEPKLAEINNVNDVALSITQNEELVVSYENRQGSQRELLYHIEEEAWSENTGRSCAVYQKRPGDTLLSGSRYEGKVLEINKSDHGHNVMEHDERSGDSIVLDNSFTSRPFYPDHNGSPGKAVVEIKEGNKPSREIRMEIFREQFGEPSERVAQSINSVKETDLSSSFEEVSFKFNTNFVLESDSRYYATLVISDSVNLESPVDIDGNIHLTDHDFKRSVTVEESGTEVVHSMGTDKILVQFYNSNDELSDLENIEIVDNETIRLTSGSQIDGTVVIADASTVIGYEEDRSFSYDEWEVVEHNLFTEDPLVQYWSDDEGLVSIETKVVDERRVEVKSSVTTEGRVIVKDGADSIDANLTGGKQEAFGHFIGQQYVLAQYYEKDGVDKKLVNINFQKVTASSGFNGSEWRSSNTGDEVGYFTSNDANSWTNNTDSNPGLRLYTFDIPWVIHTNDLDFTKPEHRKQIRQYTMDYLLGKGFFKIEFICNGVKKNEQYIFPDVNTAVWNEFRWNQATWASEQDNIAENSVSQNNIGRKISFRLSSSNSRGFSLRTFNSLIYMRSRR